jgi:cystathionine beta-lyase
VDSTDRDAMEKAVTSRTRGILVETPSNPLLKVTDLSLVAAFADKYKLVSIVDNTVSTPYFQRPLAFGLDLAVHSATKFLNGHSDVVAGLVVAREKTLADRLRFIQNAFGAALGVQDSWLLLRGLKTLAVRMDASQAGAGFLARKLACHPRVRRVHYLGLPEHPGRDVHARQASGAGALLSFELENVELTRRFLFTTRLPLVGVSMGGVESILSHPATMSHASMPEKERAARGVSDSLVRLSVGVENPEDLWADFEQALR